MQNQRMMNNLDKCEDEPVVAMGHVIKELDQKEKQIAGQKGMASMRRRISDLSLRDSEKVEWSAESLKEPL